MRGVGIKVAIVLSLISLAGACGPRPTEAPTDTPVPAIPTQVALEPTDTPVPTETPVPPTATPQPATETATPSPTATPAPTNTPTPAPTEAPTEPPSVTFHPEPGARVDVRTYGGLSNDYLYDVLALPDGGTLLAGQADNTGLSHGVIPGTARLIRTDAQGYIVWQRDYGGGLDGQLYSLVQVGDDEFVALGDIAASSVRDDDDFYLIKIDGQGNEMWSRTYGGRGSDGAKMVRQTADGGFVLTGSRADAFPTGDQYEAQIILIKTDAEGNEVWVRTYGDKPLQLGWGVAQAPDGGYVLIGYEAKTYNDRDVMLIKTDALGEVEWTRTWDLDPGDRDEGNDLILTEDGHIVIACIRSEGTGARGAVLIKVDLEGNEVWVKQYGGEDAGYEFWDIMEDRDGGYIMAGSTMPATARSSAQATRQWWVIKTDADGEVLWQHVLDIPGYDQGTLSSATVLPGGGYVFVGRARPEGARFDDMLWLKLARIDQPIQLGGQAFQPVVATYGGRFSDRAFDVLVTADGGSLVAGRADNPRSSHRIVPGDAWLIRTDASGAVLWETTYGGGLDGRFASIAPAGDNAYVLAGEIAASYARDEADVYLVKVDGQGEEIWSRTFGGRGMNYGQMVLRTADGGYVLAGDEADEFPTGYLYESNLLLFKTDAEGNEVWSRTYGDQILYLGWSVAQAPDGGYVVSGWEARTYDDRDVLLAKTDAAGRVEWWRTWDLGGRDGAFDLILSSDGHIVLVCIQSMGSGGPSARLIKVHMDGNEVWNTLVGEEGVGNTLWDLVEDVDGGYVMAGDTHLGQKTRSGEDVHGAWMVKTDPDGEIVWQHVFGVNLYQQALFTAVALVPGGGYLFVGDVTAYGKLYSDVLWLRLDG